MTDATEDVKGRELNLVFLDIDGVMVPTRAYFNRFFPGGMSPKGNADPLGVAIIKHLCNHCSAQVVFNTVWGMDPLNLLMFAYHNGLEEVVYGFDRARLPEKEAMEIFHTKYPRAESRMEAIQKWIAENVGDETTVLRWMAFDDNPGSELLESGNCVLVDPELGITVEDYRKATTLLGDHDPFVVVL